MALCLQKHQNVASSGGLVYAKLLGKLLEQQEVFALSQPTQPQSDSEATRLQPDSPWLPAGPLGEALPSTEQAHKQGPMPNQQHLHAAQDAADLVPVQPVVTPSASSLAAGATRETVLETLTQDPRRIEEILGRMEAYTQLQMEYACALRLIETRLKVLDAEFQQLNEANPIESIQTRLKSTHSIVRKMRKREIPLSVRNLEANIFDIAGVRVITSFIQDVYSLANSLSAQPDLRILQVKDYIESPKPNGYRSYHMILQVPVHFSNRRLYRNVELQFRTIAMDFWASLEHKMRYKKDLAESVEIHRRLQTCAEMSSALDLEMQEIHNQIQKL